LDRVGGKTTAIDATEPGKGLVAAPTLVVFECMWMSTVGMRAVAAASNRPAAPPFITG
jgi:hypothetical protein